MFENCFIAQRLNHYHNTVTKLNCPSIHTL